MSHQMATLLHDAKNRQPAPTKRGNDLEDRAVLARLSVSRQDLVDPASPSFQSAIHVRC